MQCPTNHHWIACKWVLRYLKRAMHMALLIRSSNIYHSMVLFIPIGPQVLMTDAQLVLTIFILAIILLHGLLRNKSWLLSLVQSHNTLLANRAAEIAWLQSLLKELQIPIPTFPVLWCENIGASLLASNHVFHSRTKQIEIDIYFIHEKVLLNMLKINYVQNSDQVADVLTKTCLLIGFDNGKEN